MNRKTTARVALADGRIVPRDADYESLPVCVKHGHQQVNDSRICRDCGISMPCTAASKQLCLDPWCDTHGVHAVVHSEPFPPVAANDAALTNIGVIVLDVVAEPGVDDISAWTDAPSEAVQAEVTDALDRCEVAEWHQIAQDHARAVKRTVKLSAAERAHDQLHNHAQLLQSQCDEQFNRVDELRWQLAREEAFLAELGTIAGRAARDSARALAKVVRLA